MICTLNLQILHDWHHATGGQTAAPDHSTGETISEDAAPITWIPNSRPPPVD